METGNQNQTQPPMNKQKESIWKNHMVTKPLLIAFLVLVLLIPTNMIQNIIEERQSTANIATDEVQSMYSGQQTIYAPIICIRTEIERITHDNKIVVENKNVREFSNLQILPEQLKINGNLETKTLKRGLYEVVVYSGPIEIEGSFNLPKEIMEMDESQLANAQINIGISDLRGISEQLLLTVNNATYKLTSGTKFCSLFTSGASSPICLNKDSQKLDFKIKISLKGSSNLSFIPLGETTEVQLTSNCSTPSFMGTFLPEERNITDNGFTASWKILNMNRNYGQIIIENDSYVDVQDSKFGVDLLMPVQHYQKSMRSIKYAILIIALTFVISFFVEIIQKKKIHPFQYLLIGLALCLFYSLLISISEHVGFTTAYIISTLMTVSLLTLYMGGMLKAWKMACIIGILLLLLYLYIFILIQMETYALLAGSIGLFVILGTIMYVSQKIDWTSLE